MSDLLLLIITLLVVAFFLQVDFIFYIVYVLAAVFAWSQWITPRSLQNLELKRIFHDHAFLGERVQIVIEIRNRSLIPIPWVQLVESTPVELRSGDVPRKAFALGARKSKTVAYTVRAMRRGYYRLGPLTVSVGDLFGFKESSERMPVNYLTVYPRIIPLNHLGLPSRLPFGTLPSHQRLYEDPARPIGVRSYYSGDSLRHVNWKVSAHADRLLVKTYQPAISLETVILLNLNRMEYAPRNRYDGPEWAITVASSLAAHLTGERQAVGLATNGVDPLLQHEGSDSDGLPFEETSGRLMAPESPLEGRDTIGNAGYDRSLLPIPIPPRPGRPHLMKILELMARIEAGQTLPFHQWIPQACTNLSWGVTILAISPDGSEETCHTLHRLVRAGYNPLLFVVTPYVNFIPIRRRAEHLGFQAFQVAQQKDLGRLTTRPIVQKSL